MYNIFAQSHTTSMRADRYPKFLSHQQYTQYLGDARKPARIDLAYIDSLCLQKLLECHSVVGVLSCGNSDPVGRESPTNGGVPKDVVRGCRLLDKPPYAQVNSRQGQP